jgi:D-alanyl-D-alanine carboxypeptidase (penicillin-binding protein 5/6)
MTGGYLQTSRKSFPHRLGVAHLKVAWRRSSICRVRWQCLVAAVFTVAILAVAAPAYSEPTPHSVPPAAPRPTSGAVSPDAPDPHPPAGGIGPYGEPVGGPRLRSRGLVLPARAKPLPANLTAAAWILADLDTGDVLAARDAHGRYQPASILKILTSITVLPLLPGKRVVTVSQNAANAEGSAVGIVAGGHYTVDQLFTGLLLMSGNDTATALAEAAGGVRHTVALMNQTALRLGAYDTLVQTPSGLDGWQQLTSAYDMAIFLRAAVNMPRFVTYDRQLVSSLPPENVHGRKYGSVWLGNQNQQFLTTVPGALVAKTGFTDAASHTFLCAASRHGRRLGVIFLRAQRYPIDQWQQATGLLDWGYALPPGAAVGHLDPPVHPAAPATPTAQALQSTARAAAAHHHSKPPWPLIGGVIALAGVGGLWLAGRRLIRPRAGGAGVR